MKVLSYISIKPNGFHNFLMDWDYPDLKVLLDNEIATPSKGGNWHIFREANLTIKEYLDELRARGADEGFILGVVVNGYGQLVIGSTNKWLDFCRVQFEEWHNDRS